jgi:phenylalanyl-tRNA synthetase beta chain
VRAPLSWLREFTPAEAAVAEIARTLSFLGLVVERVEEVAAPWEGVVVARVLDARPHPDADRVQLVDVDAGDGRALQVVCGAFNMAPGDLVPLATVGTKMPNGLEIGRRKVRGQWSEGMLCSAPELGIGEEGPVPAIYVFPPGSATPGEAVAQAFGLGADVVFELEVSPNRPDCFSVAGVARDLAAALGQPFQLPAPRHWTDEGVEAARVEVSEAARELCPRFTGTVFEGVERATVSPLVGHRLSLAGMRPISPVVDVSNYVMLELGQPNHPYDLDELAGRALVVRTAREGEEIVTLDGVSRRLSCSDLVIADGEGRAVGLAGIMGGAGPGISASTRVVLLEVANFSPGAISATGKRLGLFSEARTRFERGVDPELPPRAVDRFAELLGPHVKRGETADVLAAPIERRRVRLRPSRVNLVLGTSLAPGRCAELLGPLGFETCLSGEGDLDVAVPTWRPDCSREVDLIEEVARIYGYENIPRSLPQRRMAAAGLSRYQRGRRRVADVLTGAGLDEAWTSTFLSAAELERAGYDPAAAIEVENPLDQAQSLLRPSLLPGLLKAARANVERQAPVVGFWELGNVFSRPAPGQEVPVEGVSEHEQLGLVAIGPGADATYPARCWEVLSSGLRAPGVLVQPPPESWPGLGAFHPGRRASIFTEGRPIGLLGELAPEVAARHELPGRVAALLVDLAPLLSASALFGKSPLPQAREVSRFPATDLDMAFAVDDAVPAAALEQTVREAAEELGEEVVLFDVWRGPSLGPGRRSLAFRVRLRAKDRTLTEAEVEQVRNRAASLAHKRHGAVLRAG